MSKTHYDVLNLAKTCSEKEIKDSFIKLSKKYHPDLNNSNEAHKKFVEINEAYSVLGKSDSRRCYDNNLLQKQYYRNEGMSNPDPMRRYYDTSFYGNHQRYNTNSYYHNTSNSQYVQKNKIGAFFFCCLLITIGTGIQLSAAHKNVQRRSYIAARHMEEAKRKGQLLQEQKLSKEDVLKHPNLVSVENVPNGYSQKFNREN